MRPNYKNIYTDILQKKFPNRYDSFANILSKEELSDFDVIKLNNKIFGTTGKNNESQNQKYKSYDRSTIIEILGYQDKNKLNNSQLADHFKLSRNTVSKWRKMFADSSELKN